MAALVAAESVLPPVAIAGALAGVLVSIVIVERILIRPGPAP
jgi:hypothetical protein